MIGRWLKELLAIGMIGEGFAGFMRPRRYLLLWRLGPAPFQKWLEAMAAYPGLMRLIFAAEMGLGLWLTLQETKHIGDDARPSTR